MKGGIKKKMSEYFDLHKEFTENYDNWTNEGENVLRNALSETANLQDFKLAFEHLEIDYNGALRIEFDKLLDDDEDFKNQWGHKKEEEQNNAFYEWVQQHYQDRIEEVFENNRSYYEPIYNFLHALTIKPEEEKILKIITSTNCTVLYNEEKDIYYIALTGCGMDLSQDIGYAYLILQRWIPQDLILSIAKQRKLSINEKQFEVLKKAIIEQSKHYANEFKALKKDWEKL